MNNDDFEERRWPGRIVKLCTWLAVFAVVAWWYDHRERPVTAQQRLAIVRDTTKSAAARRIAADQLEHADASIVPELIEELQSGDTLGRELAALALGRLRSKAAVAVRPLVQAAADADASVRKQAVIALGRIEAQPQLVLSTLRAGVHDADPSIRHEAFAALGKWYPEGGEELVSLLADDDADVRRRAVIELGQIAFDTDDAGEGFVKLLDDSDPRVRAETYAALFRFSAIGAAELARGMIDDADPLVRRTAGRLFAQHPDRTADMLVRGLDDTKTDVQLAALNQLIALGETDVAIPHVLTLLDSDDKEVVRRAAMMLSRIGPPARHATERLLAHLDDPDDSVHQAIWIVLDHVGHESRLRPPELFAALHADGDTAVSFVHWGGTSSPQDYLLSDADMEHLKRLTHLQYLYLARNPIGDAGLAQLAELKELQWLDLRDTKVTSAGLQHLARLGKLRDLDLSGCAITDESLKHLSPLRELEALDLSGTPVTDAGMVHLASLCKLKSLHLWRTAVTDEGLSRLRSLSELQEVFLPEHVTLRGVAQLSGLTKIEGVAKSVSDADLEPLQALVHLRDLDLRGTSVTDAGLEYLKPLKRLQTLSLSETKVTQRGVDELREALPDLVVYGFSVATPPLPEYEVAGLKLLERLP